jgi:hypothetical protein
MVVVIVSDQVSAKKVVGFASENVHQTIFKTKDNRFLFLNRHFFTEKWFNNMFIGVYVMTSSP